LLISTCIHQNDKILIVSNLTKIEKLGAQIENKNSKIEKDYQLRQ
jgi:hypothetical protein